MSIAKRFTIRDNPSNLYFPVLVSKYFPNTYTVLFSNTKIGTYILYQLFSTSLESVLEIWFAAKNLSCYRFQFRKWVTIRLQAYNCTTTAAVKVTTSVKIVIKVQLLFFYNSCSLLSTTDWIDKWHSPKILSTISWQIHNPDHRLPG